jgi:hypothetical protein
VSYIAVFTEHNHQVLAKNLVSLNYKEIWNTLLLLSNIFGANVHTNMVCRSFF